MSDTQLSQRVTAAALRYISYRARTESEVRSRLEERYPSSIVNEVITRLREQGVLDDAKFATLWKESREAHRPRSASAIKRELVSKGVDRELAEETVSDIDDEETAYRTGLKMARRLESADRVTFQRRLFGYLRRRGFGESLSRRAVDRLWKDRSGDVARGSATDRDGARAARMEEEERCRKDI